ncbi:Glycosyl transferase family 13 [Trinorchestia longiramus]|nr:Glycosyl transferase family 13 [Trinorchestia longiramus]
MRCQLWYINVVVVVWVVVILVMLMRTPPLFNPPKVDTPQAQKKAVQIDLQLKHLENEVAEQSKFYRRVLQKLYQVSTSQQEQEETTIAVLVIACNREAAIRRSLDLLLKYRPSQARFPITVSQDCGHQPTKRVILSYEDKVTLIEQPDLSVIDVPAKEKKFKGYFYIARHYKWALDHMFFEAGYQTVIIVEDDLDISPDFFSYFSATHSLLRADPTLWCVSAWNDNGKGSLVDVENGAHLLYRTDFFPGLGWMLQRDLWEELSPKWPKSYWDDWMRAPEQRKDRTCIRPEISRTRTFGKKGVSNGLFFEKHLKFIHLNEQAVPFSSMNLTFLLKAEYDPAFERRVQAAEVVSLAQIKSGTLPSNAEYRIIYHTKDIFKKTTKALGLMDDFKAGVPRTGYRGVVTFMYQKRRFFLAPNNNWKGYDPTWS